MKKLKEKVLELVKIAQECPENLQQACFEILLKNAIGTQEPQKLAETGQNGVSNKKEPKSVVEDSSKTQDDLSYKGVHVKVRRLLEKYALTIDNLNQVFYKEGDQILPLYNDLKTTRTSESQVRITLLQCLHNAIQTGEFQTSVEAVRKEATDRKCYDVNNWANNFTNNAALFDFERYSKKLKTVTLSEQGKTELVTLVKEIQ